MTLGNDSVQTIQKESIRLAATVNKTHKCIHFELRLLTWQVLSKMTFTFLRRSLTTCYGSFTKHILVWKLPQFYQQSQNLFIFFSFGLRAISSNKMSWSSATMWPSNNTWLWLHLLMGEKWVFYITVISVGVDRAKTLNPLFNLLDQFSSTYTPLRKCRIITGYLHFILIFTHKKKKREIIDKSRRRPLCPFNRRARHDPISQIHWSSTYLQIKL